MLRAGLGTCLIVATLLVAAPAGAGDPWVASAGEAAREIDGCVQPVALQAVGARCALVEPAASHRILSDHGMTAGEPYDAQGNPVDRHGNVIAVPAGRASQAREVFASETNFLR